MQYDFDFLDQKAVWQLMEHFLETSRIDGLDSVLALLQGRPRFAATAITTCLGSPDPVEAILANTQRMVTELGSENSICANWERLYKGRAVVDLPGRGNVTLWSIAFDMLTRSLFKRGI